MSHQLKVVLLGEGCVGKTSLVLRYCHNKFTDSHESTIQASFLCKKLTIDGERVSLMIWDTAGQEKFHALGPIYYRDSNGAILVYDVTDADSLSKVKTWIKELRKMLGASVVMAIVGNKTDLQQNNELIVDAQQYASQQNATHYCTSAKLNRGIDEMFCDLTKKMLATQSTNRSVASAATSSRALRIAAEDDSDGDERRHMNNKCNC